MTSRMHSPSLTKLHSFIERLESLESQKATIQEDMQELMAEIKHDGFDTRIVRLVLKIRKKKPDQVREEEELLNLYLTALEEKSPSFR